MDGKDWTWVLVAVGCACVGAALGWYYAPIPESAPAPAALTQQDLAAVTTAMERLRADHAQIFKHQEEAHKWLLRAQIKAGNLKIEKKEQPDAANSTP